MAFKMKRSPINRKVKDFTSPIDMRSPVKNDEKERFENTYGNIDFDALQSMRVPSYTDTSTDIRVNPDNSIEVRDDDKYYYSEQPDGTVVKFPKSSGEITLTKGERIAQQLIKKNPVATLIRGRGE
tara:strand:+ start:2057 stop:2434 length:378 start_codon:yes stop_codon:yes gene_type:complete